jgi:hypothetical protein
MDSQNRDFESLAAGTCPKLTLTIRRYGESKAYVCGLDDLLTARFFWQYADETGVAFADGYEIKQPAVGMEYAVADVAEIFFGAFAGAVNSHFQRCGICHDYSPFAFGWYSM